MTTYTLVVPFLRKITIMAVLLISTLLTKAQTPYNAQIIPYTPYPFIGTEIALADDAFSGVIPIGFTFNFFGTDYTELVIGSNSVVSFNTSLAYGNCPWAISLFSLLSVSSAIGGPYQDLWVQQSGGVYYNQYGTAPDRKFVVSYYNCKNGHPGVCPTSEYTGQIVLHESTNIIDVFIADKDECTGWNGGRAIVGVKNNSEVYMAPGRGDNTSWQTMYEGWRFQYCNANYTDTVKGRVYVDLNSNCTFDGNDYGLNGRVVSSNTACAPAVTDIDGFYTLLTEQGTNNITHTYPAGVTPLCPANNINVVNFSGGYMIEDNVDFSDDPDVNCSDIVATIGTNRIRPCLTSIYYINYQNVSPVPSGPMTAIVTMPDSLTYVTSSIAPTSVVGNVYTFSLPAMGGYSAAAFSIEMLADCDITVGFVKTALLQINNTGDCDPTNNVDTDVRAVVDSWDPNEVSVANDDLYFVFGEQIASGDSLTYQINFQNTGNADAIDILVADTLQAGLDANTVVPQMSSHNYTFYNDNGRLMFTFMNINLPDSNSNEPASHGFVRFKVKQTQGNNIGTLIPNKAHIYFDNNDAVITNTATDTIAALYVKQYTKNNEFAIYPNPASDKVVLSMKNGTGNETVQVYDMTGSLVYSARMNSKQQVITTATWAKGVYMIRVNENGIAVAVKLLVVQ